MEVEFLFAGIGAIILIGFLGALLFERTKIPDILILIFIGLFIGPILLTYTDFSLLADETISEALTTFAPLFAALALVIILFDGGLNLNLEKTMQKMGVAILHTGITFIGTMFVTALICYYFLGIDNIFIGLLLGCVLGGVSSAVVIPIMAGVSAKEDTKVLLTLESVLSDVICIVTALILIEIIKGSNTDVGVLIQHLLSAFVLAGFIGFLFGVLWLTVLKRLEGKPFSFMITLAALFVLYALVEFIQVSGAIAALVFGLVLSNKNEIARILKIRTGFVFDDNIRQFHSEISFLVRTFFFVYLGLTFTFTMVNFPFSPQFYIPPELTSNPLILFFLVLFIIFLGILIIRYIAATISSSVDNDTKPDKSFITTMLPRGLAAAVLAALPFTIPEYLNGFDTAGLPTTDYFTEMAAVWGVTFNDIGTQEIMIANNPLQDLFLNMAFMMIVLTVIATSIGVSSIERYRSKKAEAEEEVKVQSDDWKEKSRTYRKHVETRPVTDWKKPEKKVKPQVVRKHPPPLPKKAVKPKKVTTTKDKKKVVVKKKDEHPLVKRSKRAKRK
jgi:cell volume regulation protein A